MSITVDLGSIATDSSPMARIGAAIADRSRAAMLLALCEARELAVTELADVAGVVHSTAVWHLAKLTSAGLVAARRQSRCTFYRLAGSDTVELVTGLARGIDARAAVPPLVVPLDHHARLCHGHLGGRLGVALGDRLIELKILRQMDGRHYLTVNGARRLRSHGIDLRRFGWDVRPRAWPCLDRTERRAHLAGDVPRSLARHARRSGWIQVVAGPRRAVTVTEEGRDALQSCLGIEV